MDANARFLAALGHRIDEAWDRLSVEARSAALADARHHKQHMMAHPLEDGTIVVAVGDLELFRLTRDEVEMMSSAPPPDTVPADWPSG